MIATLAALYLQWISIVGLLESAPTGLDKTIQEFMFQSKQYRTTLKELNSALTLEDKITQVDLLYRPATGTTLEIKYPEDVWRIARFDSPYFRCPKCDSGQVEVTISPVGREKMLVFDCYCIGCKVKWRIKIPVILEVIE